MTLSYEKYGKITPANIACFRILRSGHEEETVLASTVLLIVHALLAVGLLGAITHQTIGAWLPSRSSSGSFVARVRSVAAPAYANAVVALYLSTALIGSILYPEYRLSIRVAVEQLELPVANGIFELKEHFAALGLAILPAYWALWRQPDSGEAPRTRGLLTALLAFIVWWNFLTGHILNNIRGFGS